MEVERRGGIRQSLDSVQLNMFRRQKMTKTKAFSIDKWMVVSAYRRVKTSAGAAGIDKQSLADFDKRLVDNLYKI